MKKQKNEKVKKQRSKKILQNEKIEDREIEE